MTDLIGFLPVILKRKKSLLFQKYWPFWHSGVGNSNGDFSEFLSSEVRENTIPLRFSDAASPRTLCPSQSPSVTVSLKVHACFLCFPESSSPEPALLADPSTLFPSSFPLSTFYPSFCLFSPLYIPLVIQPAVMEC